MLTIDDFKTSSVTCEARYKNAYLIYDRTGQIVEDLREFFTDIIVSTASPPQTDFVSDEANFTLSVGTCRLTSTPPHSKAEAFAKHGKDFFGVVLDHLDVTVLTRIGLRYILRREFKTLEESKAALALMGLANLKPPKRFNSSDAPTEIIFRWEDADIGAMFRLRAETVEIKITNAPPELQDDAKKFEKKVHGLTLDVDYYTVAAVEREQWNPEEWLLEKVRIVRKEAEGILQGGGK
jgi:uncharacterized protein (TIGR04255 family)